MELEANLPKEYRPEHPDGRGLLLVHPSLEIRVAQTLAALIFEPLFEYSSVGVM